MNVSKTFAPPKSELEHLLVLQNIRILRQYQSEIRGRLNELTAHFTVLKADDAKNLAASLFEKNEVLRQTVWYKQSYQDELVDWEKSHKVNLANLLPSTEANGQLIRVAQSLTAVRQRLN